jgi:peptidyl-Lys metalloendopeptidase
VLHVSVSGNRNFKWLVGGMIGMSLVGAACDMPEQDSASQGDSTEAQASGDIQVSMAVEKASFRASDDVSVTLTFTNVGSEPAQLLKWYLPGGDSEEEVFAVTREGEPVEFIGRHYKRPVPQAGDYLTLAPGESVKGSMRLSDAYDLSRSGHYTFSYSPGEHGAGASVQLVNQLASNALSLWIEGRSANLPGVVAQGTVTAQALSTANCSSTQASSVSSAFSSAKTYASNSYNYLNTTTPGSTSRYTTWFGAYSSTGWSTVKAHFASIQDAFNNKSVIVDCNCTSSAYAYVYKGSPYRIYVCNAFWSAPTTGTDSKAGTLVHEMSHFTVVADTDDWAYGQTACKSLATSNPTNARDNADSHEYFAENTPFLN